MATKHSSGSDGVGAATDDRIRPEAAAGDCRIGRLLLRDSTSAAAGLGGDPRREAGVRPVEHPGVEARVQRSSETCSSPNACLS
jgi:hypothetical protein